MGKQIIVISFCQSRMEFPMKMIITILKTGEMYPVSKYKFISIIVSVLFYIFSVAQPFSALLFVILGSGSVNKAQAAQLCISGLHTAIKHTYFNYYHINLLKLLNDMEIIWNDVKNYPSADQILKRAIKYLKHLAIFFYASIACLYPFGIGSVAAAYYITGSEEMFFNQWLPYNLSFWSNNLSATFLCLPNAGILASYGTLLGALSFISGAYMEILQIKLINLKSNFIQFQKVVQLHQKTIRLVTDINNLFGGIIALEYFLSSLQSAFIGVAVLQAMSHMEFKSYYLLFMLIVTFVLICTICICGNIIFSQSEKIFDSVYESEWYTKTPKERKDILMIQAGSKKPLSYNYHRVVYIGLPAVLTVVQGTYSYMAAFITVYK